MTDSLKARRKGYIRNGIVKVLPVKRSSDWLPENSDSAFMNTGAKIEYVIPRNQRTGNLVDPLADLTDEEKNKIARELGLKDGGDLNVMKTPEKLNFWINKHVFIDKNGLHLNLSEVGDFIKYKIFETNLEYIAPSWEERYNKGTYKFALVFEEEESKLRNSKIDTKKEAYMMFGKMDGSVRKLSDFLWIYYLTSKDGKRLPINPTLDYLRDEVGRIVDEKPGEFMAIMSDPSFETKALIQKAVNLGLIARSGMAFTIFGEPRSNTLDELIAFLGDDRNNNVRLSLIGKIEAAEKGKISEVRKETAEAKIETTEKRKEVEELMQKFEKLEAMAKDAIETNNKLKEEIAGLRKENDGLKNLSKPAGEKPMSNLDKARAAKKAKVEAAKAEAEKIKESESNDAQK